MCFTNSKKKIEDIPSLKDHIDRAKYEYIQDLIALTQGNVKELCRISGLSGGHLYRLLKQYDIKLA
jgi:two-component system NtrC family response regulator